MVEDGWIWGEAESAGRRRLLLQRRGGEGSGLVGEGRWVSLRSALALPSKVNLAQLGACRKWRSERGGGEEDLLISG